MTAARVARAEATELSALLARVVGARRRQQPDGEALAGSLYAALHGPLQELLARPGKQMRARLCELAFSLGGGAAATLPRELPLLVEVLHAGSLIIDDIEDDSHERRGGPTLHRVFGLPVALNAGNWLYFLPGRLIAHSGLAPEVRLQAHERMSECLLRCHEGQALDLTVRVDRLPREHVLAVVRGLTERKTGALMELAASLGALAAGASEARIDALARFGRELGSGLQMLDDLSGVINPMRADKAQEDLAHARATWVWAWLAQEGDPAVYAELIGELRSARETGETAALLQELRFRLAVTGLRHAQCHLEQAVDALAAEVGEGPWRAAVEDELRWLTQRFVGG